METIAKVLFSQSIVMTIFCVWVQCDKIVNNNASMGKISIILFTLFVVLSMFLLPLSVPGGGDESPFSENQLPHLLGN